MTNFQNATDHQTSNVQSNLLRIVMVTSKAWGLIVTGFQTPPTSAQPPLTALGTQPVRTSTLHIPQWPDLGLQWAW